MKAKTRKIKRFEVRLSTNGGYWVLILYYTRGKCRLVKTNESYYEVLQWASSLDLTQPMEDTAS